VVYASHSFYNHSCAPNAYLSHQQQSRPSDFERFGLFITKTVVDRQCSFVAPGSRGSLNHPELFAAFGLDEGRTTGVSREKLWLSLQLPSVLWYLL